MASVWPAKNNYATGDVLTAANMNGIGDDLNDLYNSYSRAAGKNAVINGGFDIWQRGTSIALAASTPAASSYNVDRFMMPTNANQAFTISRQAVNDSTNLPNIQYCARIQRNSGQTGTSGVDFTCNLETANSVPYAGKTITFSFYARAGANYSPTSSALTVQLYTGTGTDQNIQTTGLTNQTAIVNTTATLTTTWQRFTYTVTTGSTISQLATIFKMTPVGTAGAADYYEITGIQIELGSSATPFARAGGTVQGELAACRRYLPAFGGIGNNFVGLVQSTTSTIAIFPFDVPARVVPTGITYSALSDFRVYNKSSSYGNPTAMGFNSGGINNGSVNFTTTAGTPTLVAGEIAQLYYPTSSGLILFTGCEL